MFRAQPALALGDRRKERILIEALMQRRRRAVCEENQGRALQMSVGYAIDGAGGARTNAGQNDTRRSGQLPGHGSH
jgi:hypothetical protein